MTIQDALTDATQRLSAAGVETPRVDSEFLLAALLGQSRSDVLLHRDEPLPAVHANRLNDWLKERSRRKPLAYVTGEQPFGGHSFRITEDVLVPRPETELLVEHAYQWLSEGQGDAFVVGTGSGVIAISLAMHPRVRRTIGIDASTDALAIARENAADHGVSIDFYFGDLLKTLGESEGKATLLIANLPYVRRSEIDALAPELQWEPRLALDGGEDGLDLIRELIQEAPRHLTAGGALFLEIGWDQGVAVTEILTADKEWTGIEIFKDLAGHPRIVKAIRKGL
jgi:release factor glutamine methyltransferase